MFFAMRKHLLQFISALALAAVGAPSAIAASSSWSEIAGAKIRMLAVADASGQTIDGAFEVELADGWKTYWRTPGDSGIPPTFDFTGSQNLDFATVGFPVPSDIRQGEARIVGYKSRVIFPFSARLSGTLDRAKIIASVLIGVCAEICVPASSQFELNADELKTGNLRHRLVLLEGISRLPKPPKQNFRIVSVSHWDSAAAVLTVTANLPDGVTEAELFIEGQAGWPIYPGELMAVDDGVARFRVDLSAVPKDVNIHVEPLRYTLVAGGIGIEETRMAGQ